MLRAAKILRSFSLLLCAAVCALWLCAQIFSAQWIFGKSPNIRHLTLNRVGISLTSFTGVGTDIATYHLIAPATDVFVDLRPFPRQTVSFLGFCYLHLTEPKPPHFQTLAAIVIPYWVLAVTFASPAVWFWMRRRRGMRSARPIQHLGDDGAK